MLKMSLPVLFVVATCISSAALVTAENDFPRLNHLRAATSPEEQAQAVKDLIRRLIESRASEFAVSVDTRIGPPNKDTFQLTKSNGVVSIVGTSGVAAAWGFYYYLSQYCGCHISWAGDQIRLPFPLPSLPDTGVTVTSNDRFRYYQNVCTVSYSSVWWNWTRWERELDWMAMNGINLALAFTGQEAIWRRVLLKMGFSSLEINNHFGGPAFLAWSRMGNMHGWGGPLPESWHINQVALQHKILDRMRSFGMIPVLPAFSGDVPNAISRLFPSAKVTQLSNWGDFSKDFCCVKLLDVNDPLFSTFGKAFLDEYISEFGTNHVYNTDTFNEMDPSSSDPSYLKQAGRAVFEAMTAADPDAVWLMQGWLFLGTDFWKPPQAEALLTSVPQGRMIVLDLMAETRPQFTRLQSYFGQPFIWCMLHNFGGTLSLFGNIDFVNEGPSQGRAFANSTMIGIGLTMEGINQNNMIYEFMLENSWRAQPRNIASWIENYSTRRYGMQSTEANNAWQMLKSSVYNCTDHAKHHFRDGIVKRPDMKIKFDVGVYNCTDAGYGNSNNDLVTRVPHFDPPVQPFVGVYNCTNKGYGNFNNDLVTQLPQVDPPVRPYQKLPDPRLLTSPPRFLAGCIIMDDAMRVYVHLLVGEAQIWYDTKIFFKAWDFMIDASASLTDSYLFRYDLVDVTRHALNIVALSFYNDVLNAYKSKNYSLFRQSSQDLKAVLLDLNKLLATDDHFLLGRWLESAKALAVDSWEARLYEYNARNQLTLWGPDANILDYASKQWAGLVEAYYYPRWSLFLDELQNQWNNTFDQSLYNIEVFNNVEQPFTFDRKSYPTVTIGDQIAVAREMHQRYRPVTRQRASFFRRLRKLSQRQQNSSNASSSSASMAMSGSAATSGSLKYSHGHRDKVARKVSFVHGRSL